MPEWLLLLAVVFLILRVRRGRRRRGHLFDPHARTHGLRYGGGKRLNPPAAAPVPTETPMESLQREFVAGTITVEQYEVEVDRLLRRPGGGATGPAA